MTFRYSFLGGRETVSTLAVPRSEGDDDSDRVREAFAHCGLVVLCWHWMATPCGRVESAAVALDDEERAFWRAFYRDAFAEFVAVNGLEPATCDVDVASTAAAAPRSAAVAAPPRKSRRVLCGLGGGKDSLVARFLAARQAAVEACDWIYVDDGGGEYDGSRRLGAVVAASGAPCVVLRHDFGYEALLSRRSTRAAPCGHPWAALVAFDAVGAAKVLGYDAVVVGNERSAAHGNGVFVGDVEVNHQFDKSLAWEKRFQTYFAKRGWRGDYFSPLQRLWDVQIAGIFALERDLEVFWDLFRSCNDSGDVDAWCGGCDKCCFVHLVMRAFRSRGDVAAVFKGKDLFEDERLLANFAALADASGAKPFECVGTADEAVVALELARLQVDDAGAGAPFVLAALPRFDASAAADLLDDAWAAAPSPAWWDDAVLDDLPSVARLARLKGLLVRGGRTRASD